MNPWVLLGAAYLLGSMPSSYLAGRLVRGIDLRRHGSGNLGATNAFRVLGWRVAIPVLLLDIAKGWIPAWAFPRLADTGVEWALAFGGAAIVGHVFSVFLGFRGGKGVATTAGAFLAIAPLAVAAGLAAWVVVVALTRTVSLASILAAVVVPAVVLVTAGPGVIFAVAVAASLFVIAVHRSNIRRLIRGEEPRFAGRSSR